MNAAKKKGDTYYPLRWRVADFFENIIILYRTKAAFFIAALGVLVVIAGLFVLGWRPWSSDETSSSDEPAVTEIEDDDQPVQQEEQLVQQEEQLVAALVFRPIATEEELLLTTPGTVIELGPTVMRVNGGQQTDDAAEAAIALATGLFPTREVFDAQLLSSRFPTSDTITVRIVEPSLFDNGTAEINPDFAPLFDDIAAAITNNGAAVVEVQGHGLDEPLSGQQAQAAVDQIIAAGVPAAIVIPVSFGNVEPIAEFDSRIDFVIR